MPFSLTRTAPHGTLRPCSPRGPGLHGGSQPLTNHARMLLLLVLLAAWEKKKRERGKEMQLMNWKNNTLGRISIEIKCVLFSGKGKSSPREKKKNISPPPNTHTRLHPGLSPLCLTMYMMWVCVFVSECLSVPLAYDHKHQEMLCYKS